MGTALSDVCNSFKSPFSSLISIKPTSSSLVRISTIKLAGLPADEKHKPDELSPTTKSEHSHLDTTVTIGDETLAEIQDDRYLLPEDSQTNLDTEKRNLNSTAASSCLQHSLSCPLPAKRKLVSLRDFSLSRLLSHGPCGKSYLICKKLTKRREFFRASKSDLAMKILHKNDEKSHSLFVRYYEDQPQIRRMDCDFIVELKHAFLNKNKIFLIMEHYDNSYLSQILTSYQKFPEVSVKFYSAQLVLALEYLHTHRGVTHANLHMEKILLDKEGNLKITDICNCSGGQTLRRQLTRNTLSYKAPENTDDGLPSKNSDFWSLGVFIYHLSCGHLPFLKDFTNNNYMHDDSSFFEEHDADELRVEYPEEMSRNCMDLISRLLEQSPERRLGVHGFQEIKRHCFFREINWENLTTFQVKPPMRPHRKLSESDIFEGSDGEGHVIATAQFNVEEYEIA